MISQNRQLFLSELRSGKYKKGCIKSDEKGYPVIESEADNDGHCSCAIMVLLFGGPKFSLPKAVKALGISSQDCTYIQKNLNDTGLTFSEQADEIERRIFNNPKTMVDKLIRKYEEKIIQAEKAIKSLSRDMGKQTSHQARNTVDRCRTTHRTTIIPIYKEIIKELNGINQ